MTDARTLTLDAGGRWAGRYGTAPCPVCQPERRRGQNALTLADGSGGRLLAHCKKGCAFRDVAAAMGLTGGAFAPPDPAEAERRRAAERAKAKKKAAQARRCWAEAAPIAGTLAERYLRGRGVTAALGEALRFHPECWHGPTARRLPAMVARVDGAEGFAIHRTYLAPDGRGKAPVEPAKMMLGATAGGAVRLADTPGPLVVSEGIETALSLASGLLPNPPGLWAALSASGMAALRLPREPGRLVVAPDGDRAGRGAAHVLAERASIEGWRVSLLTPPEGGDFNDLLTGRAAA